jgi:hypothetical protein
MDDVREFRFDGEDEATISEAVVKALATASGTDGAAFEPLYASIDPEALDSLVTGTSDELELRAHYRDVSSHGRRDALPHGVTNVRPQPQPTGTRSRNLH